MVSKDKLYFNDFIFILLKGRDLLEMKNEKEKMEIEIFKNEEFGKIRTALINDKPYFCANDVAKALGYKRTADAVSSHCKGSVKYRYLTNGGEQETKFIPEGDVYRLITHSKLPAAEKFESWVFDEVLPTLRRTGGYVNNIDIMVNTYFSEIPSEQQTLVRGLLVNIEEKQKKIISLSHENDLLAQKNLKWADRPLINSLVRSYACSIGNNFGKAWNEFKKELLYKYSINLNSRITNFLNNSGKRTKPKTLDMLDDSEIPNALSTIVSMCKENDVNIDDILNKKAE